MHEVAQAHSFQQHAQKWIDGITLNDEGDESGNSSKSEILGKCTPNTSTG